MFHALLREDMAVHTRWLGLCSLASDCTPREIVHLSDFSGAIVFLLLHAEAGVQQDILEASRIIF